MIPILYESNETAFLNQGLGALGDAVSVSVSRALNGKDELVLLYPSDGIRYADIKNDRIIYAQPEYRKSAQPYQIYQITKPLNGLVTIYARHGGMQRAKYIPVTAFTAASAVDVFYQLPQHLAEANPFTFWTNKNTTANFKLTRPASLGNVLGGMEGSILDVYGGEYEFDGYTVRLWDKRGAENGVQLRYGKNITSIEQTEDFAPIVTGVCPYWEGMDGGIVVLPEVVVQGAYADSYAFRRTIVRDFTEQFEEAPTVEQLRDAATAYISNNSLGVPNINLKVNFEHLAQYTEYEGMALLETVNLGDTIEIYYEPLSVSATARIVSTTYDCLNEKYTSVQVGSVRSNLEQVMNQMTATTKTLKDTLTQSIPSALAEAVSHTTDMITGANGGYVVMNSDADGKPYEILIMDTDDPATAVNVLRLNQNGIGFSTSGYNGPFNTAWTIDGNFVADYITTGTLNANVIRAGIISDTTGKNSWNLDTGALTITDGLINIETSSATSDQIKLRYTLNANYDYVTAMMASGFRAQNLAVAYGSTGREISFGASSVMGSDVRQASGVGYGKGFTLADGSLSLFGHDGTTAGQTRITLFTTATSAYDAGLTISRSGGKTVLTYDGGAFYNSSGKARMQIAGTSGVLYCNDTSGTPMSTLSPGTLVMGGSGTTGAITLNDTGAVKSSYMDASQIRFTNGAGKYYFQMNSGNVYIGDGTAQWRGLLNTAGLTFYNSSGTQTALYPSGGLTYTAGAQLATSLTSGTSTDLRSVSLPAGKYLLIGQASFASNATGNRRLTIGVNSATIASGIAWEWVPAISGASTRINLTGYYEFSATTTVYLVAMQSSGSTVNIESSALKCIKLP